MTQRASGAHQRGFVPADDEVENNGGCVKQFGIDGHR